MSARSRLSREVRCSIIGIGDTESALRSSRGNTHAGWPSQGQLAGGAWTVRVEVEGVPDPRTGYLVGIDRIDAAVREHAIPRLVEAAAEGPLTGPGAVRLIAESIDGPLQPKADAVMLKTEPMSWWRVESVDMSRTLFRRRYEFSASHRLHLPELDDEANAELFGKCSNPNGHGHNYEVEVQVAVGDGSEAMSVAELDRVVDRVVIDRFDHKHLNLDLEDFRDRVASVENIAARCVDLLVDPIGELGDAVRLEAVTVWETPRTSCTVTAPNP